VRRACCADFLMDEVPMTIIGCVCEILTAAWCGDASHGPLSWVKYIIHSMLSIFPLLSHLSDLSQITLSWNTAFLCDAH
jgi:hypothetical protein